MRTRARAEAIVLVETILDAPSGVRTQKTQLALTRLGDTGVEVGRVGFAAWAIGDGGWESLHDDGIATMERGREMATNNRNATRRALFEALVHVSEDVPEHD